MAKREELVPGSRWHMCYGTHIVEVVSVQPGIVSWMCVGAGEGHNGYGAYPVGYLGGDVADAFLSRVGETPSDPVNHPTHYNRGGIECIDVIEAWGLDYCLGNALKYICRAGHKDKVKEVEDLKKAAYYVNHRIAELEKAK